MFLAPPHPIPLSPLGRCRRPIVRMALSPFADCVAVATAAGVFSVDLLDPGLAVTPISTGTYRSPITALTWNGATSEVIVAGGPFPNGTVSVYKQLVGGGGY